MAERQGIEWIIALQRRWKAELFVFCLLLGVTVPIVLRVLLGWGLWMGVAVFLFCFVVLSGVFPFWRISLTDTARYLDRELPELEESCGLLLRPGGELGPLERLQVARMEARLRPLRMPQPMRGKLRLATGLFVLAVLGMIVSGSFGGRIRGAGNRVAGGMASVVAPVAAPPGVKGVTVTITPPAYTGRRSRQQGVFPLQVEEGALVSWEVETSGKADTVSFLFNDTAQKILRGDGKVWRLSMVLLHAGFYQVRVGKQVSELYKLELIKDEPPKITIMRPKGYTLIDYGEPTRVPLTVKMRDDYGIREASVMATVSSGKGEAVKFKEQELSWGAGFAGGQRAYDLTRTLDLVALGLKPGDELYFYCRAKDNHGQEARTDMYIITLADTAQLMSLEGMTVATDVKPEFFRSERQIIIEAEQLLKVKDTLSVADFNRKSNDLGIDQKLLRLRYGKFLGEEAEEGGDEDKAAIAAGSGAFGDAAKVLDAYTDKHDNAEDASFFEPGVKAQLKATLSEMWSAELRLRTYKPQEALPFAYKALRLLKDLQQQSRTYVAKTSAKLTPLNPAKRLTGELSAIQAPVQRAEKGTGLTEEETLRIVLGLLGSGAVRGSGSRVLLEQAERRLGVAAAGKPGEFLAGYEEMRKIVAGGVGNVLIVEQAIRRLLPVAEAVPLGRRAGADAGLSQYYFSHIGKP